LARARCSSTRWLPSEISKTEAHLFGAPALDVAQADDRPLSCRQLLDRRRDQLPGLRRQQALLRRLPGGRRRRPVPRPALMVGAKEALGVHRGLPFGGLARCQARNGTERRSRDARVLATLVGIRKIQVFSEERPSKRSNPRSTPSHVSCTTSSATARLPT
jgi:hypothetical protein